MRLRKHMKKVANTNYQYNDLSGQAKQVALQNYIDHLETDPESQLACREIFDEMLREKLENMGHDTRGGYFRFHLKNHGIEDLSYQNEEDEMNQEEIEEVMEDVANQLVEEFYSESQLIQAMQASNTTFNENGDLN